MLLREEFVNEGSGEKGGIQNLLASAAPAKYNIPISEWYNFIG